MESIVLLSFLKQKAKQIKKEKLLSQHQALNEAAKELGYSNYKNYLNLLESNRKQSKPSKEVLLKNISLENDMTIKKELAISFIQNYEAPFEDLLNVVKLFQDSEKAMQVVCEALNLKDEIQLYLLDDLLTEEGQSEIVIDNPYYRAKDIYLSNLCYEINEDTISVDGDHKITIESEVELDDEQCREHPHLKDRFKDRSFTGAFGIEIDKNKEITLIHMDW